MDLSALLRPAGSASLPSPDPTLDRYLDAFESVASRFGIGRTTAQDVAREAGVDRTTVFRNVGRLEDLQRLYAAREIHRFIDAVLGQIPDGLDGPATVVEILVIAIDRAAVHPVLAKVLADEPDVIGHLIPEYLEVILDRAVGVLAPGLAMAASIGLIRPLAAEAVAEWIARFGVTVLVSPPTTPVRDLLDAVLRPMLTPPAP